MPGLIAKNIVHRPVRNGALILVFAFIAASLFSGNYLLLGASDSVKSGISRLGADIIVVPEGNSSESETVLLRGEPSTFFFPEELVPRIGNVTGVEQVAPQIFISSLAADCCSQQVQIIAFDPSRDFTITPWLREKQEKPLGKDEIIVGSNIVGDIGSGLTFYGHQFTVAGRLDPTGTGVDNSVFVRMEDAYVMAAESDGKSLEPVSLSPGVVSAVLVKVKDTSGTTDVGNRIAELVPGTKVITAKSLMSNVSGRLGATTRALDFAALAATLISLPLVALISIMAAHERRREIGVLRALGATRAMIFRILFGEAVVIAATGAILGIAVSWGILALFQQYIAIAARIPLAIPSVGSLVALAGFSFIVTVAVGGIAALYPAVRSARMDPYEAMRSGEL